VKIWNGWTKRNKKRRREFAIGNACGSIIFANIFTFSMIFDIIMQEISDRIRKGCVFYEI